MEEGGWPGKPGPGRVLGSLGLRLGVGPGGVEYGLNLSWRRRVPRGHLES